MFTPEQLMTAIAVNACVEPESMLSKYLGSMLKLKVNPDDLRIPQYEFTAIFDKLIRDAILGDGVITSDEEAVLDFIEQLKEDEAKAEELGQDFMSMVRGV